MVKLGVGLMIVEILLAVAAAQVVEILPNTSSTSDGVILGLNDTPQTVSPVFEQAPAQNQPSDPLTFDSTFDIIDRLIENGGELTPADRAWLQEMERRLRAEASGESADSWNAATRLNGSIDRFIGRFHNTLAAERQRYYQGLRSSPTWRSARTGPGAER